MANGSQVLEPKLFCRTTSSLVWHWENADLLQAPSARYVVSVRNHEETWFWHDVVSEAKFAIDELPPDSKFQLEVLYVGEDGSFIGPCSSEWVSTLSEYFTPSAVVNLVVAEEYQFSENYVNRSIKWEPNKEDMTCDYKILHWNVRGKRQPEERNLQMKFSATLANLDFNQSYRAYVISGDSETNSWGEGAGLNFTTPSCLHVWNNNLSICCPPPPAIININFLSVGEGNFDMNISWIPDRITPESYAVSMSEVESSTHRSEQKIVDGNTTSVIFKNTKPETLYHGCVTAMSSAGNSTQECKHRKFRAPPTTIPKKLELSEITIVLISVTTLVAIIAVTAFLYYRHYKKRGQNLQSSQIFQKLDTEPSTEKDNESIGLCIDDEWEIPETRIEVQAEVGGGAFGVVYRGLLKGKTSQEPSRLVAVKMLRDYSNFEEVRQFHQEIDVMKSAGTHPNIVSIIGCCTSSKQAKLIVEYCPYGSLLKYLRKFQNLGGDENANQCKAESTKPIKYAQLMSLDRNNDAESSEHEKEGVAVNPMYFDDSGEKKPKKCSSQQEDLLSFARQIAMGMEFLASNRIVHRDLAARNVLVCANKTVKICDFGLSKDVYEQNVYHKKGQGRLPFKWLAIESILYQIYTTQTDIWSFGILLWEIVTLGKMPYHWILTQDLVQLLISGYRLERPPNCSQELYEVMLSCWRAKPKERPTFTELRNKLDSLLETTSAQQYLLLNDTDTQNLEMTPAENQSLSDDHKHTDNLSSSQHEKVSTVEEQNNS